MSGGVQNESSLKWLDFSTFIHQVDAKQGTDANANFVTLGGKGVRISPSTKPPTLEENERLRCGLYKALDQKSSIRNECKQAIAQKLGITVSEDGSLSVDKTVGKLTVADVRQIFNATTTGIFTDDAGREHAVFHKAQDAAVSSYEVSVEMSVKGKTINNVWDFEVVDAFAEVEMLECAEDAAESREVCLNQLRTMSKNDLDSQIANYVKPFTKAVYELVTCADKFPDIDGVPDLQTQRYTFDYMKRKMAGNCMPLACLRCLKGKGAESIVNQIQEKIKTLIEDGLERKITLKHKGAKECLKNLKDQIEFEFHLIKQQIARNNG